MAKTSPYKQVSMRLSPTGGALLDELSRRRGISKTALIETLLRDTAEAKGIAVPEYFDPRLLRGYSEETTEEDMREFTAASIRRFDEEEETANANV